MTSAARPSPTARPRQLTMIRGVSGTSAGVPGRSPSRTDPDSIQPTQPANSGIGAALHRRSGEEIRMLGTAPSSRRYPTIDDLVRASRAKFWADRF